MAVREATRLPDVLVLLSNQQSSARGAWTQRRAARRAPPRRGGALYLPRWVENSPTPSQPRRNGSGDTLGASPSPARPAADPAGTHRIQMPRGAHDAARARAASAEATQTGDTARASGRELAHAAASPTATAGGRPPPHHHPAQRPARRRTRRALTGPDRPRAQRAAE
jgi:hypothetical protein